jgi:Na+-driven multidrug efflux pump
LFGLTINGVIGLLIFFFPEFFLVLFSREQEFIDTARPWLMVMLVSFLSLGWTAAMDQSFQQAGDTKTVMLVNFVTLWAVVPLAFFLSRATPLAELGVAWGMATSLLFRPLAYTPYFFAGRWLRIRLFASEAPLGDGRSH